LTQSNPKILDDYHQVFRENLGLLPLDKFKEKLVKVLFPQYQTAQNMGFSYPFIYKK
jgi:hypothetical protein